MTKQATKAFVKELIEMLELSSGRPLMREYMAADLEARDPAELAREFGRVEALLQGLEYTGEESLGIAGSIVFGEAKILSNHARHICEDHVR